MKTPLALALLFSLSSALAAAPPNIVVIYTDDVGYGDVSCYEGCSFKTPNIDNLAAQG